MFTLIILLISNVGFLMLLAYINSRLILYKDPRIQQSPFNRSFIYICIFTLFTIISNVTGVEILPDLTYQQLHSFHIQPEAILANTRVLTISVSGLIGGPWVGIVVGLIAGIIRYLQGGYIALTYLTSSVMIGCISSFFAYWRKKSIFALSLWELGALGIFLESLQMLLIYLFSPNPQQAMAYIQFISLPMMAANSIGIVLFISLVQSLISLDQSTKLFQTQYIYSMARDSLPVTYSGFGRESAKHLAQLLKDSMDVEGIIIAKPSQILYHSCDLSNSNNIFHLERIHQNLKSSPQVLVNDSSYLIDPDAIHPQKQVLILPLQLQQEYLGTVILIFPINHVVNSTTQQIIETILDIFTLQLELQHSQHQAQLLKDAEIKSLQAQVNPHFLFNAINIIAALCRTQPLKARQQLLELATYFRANIDGARSQFIAISQELQHVQAFLSIQLARFPDRYKIDYHIDQSCVSYHIPPFVIQMLVENAFRHAFVEKAQDNHIIITIYKNSQELFIIVEDNGIGMSSEQIQKVYHPQVGQELQGTALRNIQQRLEYLYDQQATFKINSHSEGTRISITIPIS